MLKLNAGFSRKVGEPNYGSRGACVNVELEVESNLVSDPEALANRIHGLFALARDAVDRELNENAPPSNGREQNSSGNGHANDRFAGSNGRHDRPASRGATASQVRAIRAICQRQRIDADQLANERFSVTAVEELTLPEASSLIDELKAAPSNGQNGGAR